MSMGSEKMRYIKFVAMGTVVLGMTFLLVGCGLRKYDQNPSSMEEVYKDLRTYLNEECKVVSSEELPDTEDKFNIVAYEAYSKVDPTLRFVIFEYASRDNAISERIMTNMMNAFGHAIVKKEVFDWLDGEQWKYDVGYSSRFLQTEDEELNEKYETNIEIDIYLSEIEGERAELAEGLANVIKKIRFSNYASGFFVARDEYKIFIRLYYTEVGEERQECIQLIGTEDEPLEISREGLINAFKNSKEKETRKDW